MIRKSQHLFNLILLIGFTLLPRPAVSQPGNGNSGPQGLQTDILLVQFKNNLPAGQIQQISAENQFVELSEIAAIGVRKFRVSASDNAGAAAARLRSHHAQQINFAESEQVLPPEFIPNDPFFSGSWHLPMVSAPQAWDWSQGSQVTIAILDTGVAPSHPDLQLVPGWNFFDNNSDTHDVYGHGTAVAGVAAAVGNNGIGVIGVAPTASVMPCRISDPNGWGSSSIVALALVWAADHGARVANVSYAFTTSLAVASAAHYFQNSGGVVVMAAGNDTYFDPTSDNPAVLTVSATDSADNLATWSNTGNTIDLSAPGVGIYTTTNCGTTCSASGTYGSGTGTSFSSPLVAGVAALVIAANPALSAQQIQDVLKQSADDRGSAGWDVGYGWGRVNAAAAVNLALNNPPVATDTTPPSVSHLLGALSGSSIVLNWTAATDNVGVAGYKIFRNGVEMTTTPANSHTDSTTQPATTYAYTVRAFDAAGNISAASNGVSLTSPPVQPTLTLSNIAVSNRATSSATINWQTNITAAGFVRYGLTATNLNLTSATTGPATTAAMNLTGLTKNKRYYYQIMVTNGSMLASSAIGNFKTLVR